MRIIGYLVILLGISGCASVGPSGISAGRGAYNVAIQQTNDQELLLNLVRILYRDTLYFTNVERIAATQELLRTVGVSAGVTQSANSFAGVPSATSITGALSKSLSLGTTSISVNEKPTVFYAPLDGEKFVRQMMTPMNPELLLLLVNSGWSLDRVFSVGLQEMNGLKNAPTAAGSTPSREPEFKDFREAVLLLRALQREQLIELVKVEKGVELRFIREASSREETARLRVLLKLSPKLDRFHIIASGDAPDAGAIAITTRPLVSALSYLSQGIDAPSADMKAGKVRQTVRSNGSVFDWQELLQGVFHVRSSKQEPVDASVVIFYRGSYFYIADNDLDTKSTFVLLTQLIALHSVPASSSPPMSISFAK